MIRRVYSSLKSFRTVTFKTGLNILLADRNTTATQQDTRNGAGKTSLVEIIHFLTGSKSDASSLCQHKALREHEFGMEFDVAGATLSVQRSGAKPTDVTVLKLAGRTDHWFNDPFADRTELQLRNSEWSTMLGELFFDLRSIESGPIKNYRPKFRALFAYYVRRQSSNAFLEPICQSKDQAAWDQQVMLSYLLGLDWTIPREWQLIRDREKALKELRRAAGGEFKAVIGSAASLRAELAATEAGVARTKKSVDEYRVLPTYADRQAEADAIAREFTEARDSNYADHALITDVERALAEETPPEVGDLDQVYREVGVILPDVVLRRFDEVRQFHLSVVSNRRSYLERELAEARQRVKDRTTRMEALDRRRAEIMQLLASHGALEQLTALQVDLAREEAKATTLRGRFDAAQQLESTKAELDIERRQLQLRLQQDYQEREPVLRAAIVTLGNVVQQLYGSRPGRLLLEPTPNGPAISVKIDGDRSKGIGNMEIFSFDMMLMRRTAERHLGPDFWVHDSHIFDGVDERQRAAALGVGRQIAIETGRQYIVTMNSDELPRLEARPVGLKFEDDILPVRLDDTKNGGLFGMRFD